MKSLYEGIENTDVIYDIKCQLEDYEINEFERLKREFMIASDSHKKDAIRCKMAILLGKEKDEEVSKSSDFVSVQKTENKEVEVKESSFAPIPDTIEGIREEYEKINEELIKGNGNPELYERYLMLKQRAEELEEKSDDNVKIEETESEKSVLTEELERLLDDIPSRQGIVFPNTKDVEITPEELKVLLGDVSKGHEVSKASEGVEEQETILVEESDGENKTISWFRKVGQKLASRKRIGKDVRKENQVTNPNYEKVTASDKVVGEVGVEDDEIVVYEGIIDEEIIINPESIDESYKEDLLVGSDTPIQEGDNIEELPTGSDIAEQEDAEREKTSKEGDVARQEPKRDLLQEFGALPDEEKREMLMKIIDEVLGNKEAKAKKEEEAEAEKKRKTIVENAQVKRKTIVENAQVKRKAKEYIEERPVMEWEGEKFSDLSSRMAIAEFILTGKLGSDKMLIAIGGNIFSMKQDGKMIKLEYGKESQNPFETAKNKELGKGDRGKKVGEEMEYSY